MIATSIAVYGFGFAALAFAALAVLLLTNLRGRRIGKLLLLAALVEAGWALTLALASSGMALPPWLPSVAEACRAFAWFAFLVALPKAGSGDARRDAQALGAPITQVRRWAFAIAIALTTGSIVADAVPGAGVWSLATKLLLALFALVLVEQLFRNTAPSQRWAIKFLCIALVAMFGFDVVLFGDAMLYGRIRPEWWAARGVANALMVPMIAIAVARARQWQVDITVSRRIVVHSALLAVAAAYLVIVAVAAVLLRNYGAGWGAIAQALVVFIAFVGLAVTAVSGRARAWLRVTVAKNFFSYRYDYRQEWLAFTDALAAPSNEDPALGDRDTPLDRRVVAAIARLVEARSGALWIREDTGHARDEYRCVTAWKVDQPTERFAVTDPLPRFLADRGWIVDVSKAMRNAGEYPGLELPAGWQDAHRQEDCWLLVPMVSHDALIGFVLLGRPAVPVKLDWEVTDLLKTAGRQAASVLSQRQAYAALLQARQFESFNRMSAFVVHEMKNLVAQLDLMAGNAVRHRDNPEFQADMLATVQNVIERGRRLLLQLRVGATPVESPQAVALLDMVNATMATRNGMRPPPRVAANPAPARVRVHPERMQRVIGHLLQNAAEATGPEGRIDVRVLADGADAVLEIEDDGQGMTQEFIRERLYKPFESTKPMGMGIGVFESREYIRELGGQLDVRSRPGVGTVFAIRLPALQVPPAGVAGPHEATARAPASA